MWDPAGVPLCIAPGNETPASVLSVASPFLQVAWVDRRGPLPAVFAQSVGAGGVKHWTECAVPLTQWVDHFQGAHVAASDGHAGVVEAWVENYRLCGADPGDIYAHRVTGSGNLMWGPSPTAVCLASGAQRDPAIAPDGAGGAFVAWIDERSGGDPEIFAQHVTADGGTSWTVDGVLVCSAAGTRQDIGIVAVGAGGADLVWSDTRGPDPDLYVQHLSAAGIPTLVVDGALVCGAVGAQLSPQLAPLPLGGGVVVWEDYRPGVLPDIYAHHVGVTGAPDPAWPVDGAPVCVDPAAQKQPQIDGNLTITWSDARAGGLNIYAQRISPMAGASLWLLDGIAVCGAPGDQRNPRVAGSGTASIIAWEDPRLGLGDYDVFAQILSAGGTASWVAGGVAVCAANGDQIDISIAGDGSGGAVLVWSDRRNGTDLDLYAQRYIPTSARGLWAPGGISISSAQWDQSAAALLGDDYGGGVVSWLDARWGTTLLVYTARLSPSGKYLYTAVEETPRAGSAILHQNVPNPFNPSTRIVFVMPREGRVRLEIYDVKGALVTSLFDGDRPAGNHRVYWHGVDRSGTPVASGVYFYQLEALGVRTTRRMVLLK